MTALFGYGLSSVIALSIVLIGARFFFFSVLRRRRFWCHS